MGKRDLVLSFLLGWAGDGAGRPAAQAVPSLWCTQHRETWRGRPLSANSAFGVYLAWYHSSRSSHSAAPHVPLPDLGRGQRKQPFLSASCLQNHWQPGFSARKKCLVILQSCCPFPRISPPFSILDRLQQPTPSSALCKAASAGPDSVFPLFRAEEQHCSSRVRALHVCTESNSLGSTCSDEYSSLRGSSSKQCRH